jgi:2-polyprenyl-3-methyl-5-hydroxy-6-metoxy-1,4-benzoquinol methylase
MKTRIRKRGSKLPGQARGAERYHVPMDAFIGKAGSSQWTVCAWMPPGLRVLDVGCAGGSLAQCLGKVRGCRVTGVERDPRLAARARPYCDKIHVGDVESGKVLAKIKGPFDAVVFADVLEHLRDPEAALSAAARFLRNDGHVYVSVPNVANWRVRLGLLAGRFAYSDTGILDRTHLHLFTRRSALDMLRGCGFEPVGMKTTSGKGRLIPRMLSALAPEWFAFQFIFKAVKCRPSR